MRTPVVCAVVAVAVLIGTGTAVATSLTVTSKKLGAAQVTAPAMFPTTITIANGVGGVAGQAENGDIITFVFSQQIDETTLCSGWSNSLSTQSVQEGWAILPGSGGADDTLEVNNPASTCANGFNIGTVDLGSAGYNTGSSNIRFTSTTAALVVGPSTSTLTVTLSGIKGSGGTVSAGSPAVWTPDSSLKDRSGRTCGNNLAQSTATVQF
ncbi:MAG TPA: hypothetical protein VG650_01390 [Mycobacteriales bacterium]|nr:hypothetical protein [Mycobacteriales bacterium]